ncbi:MAG: Trk system potassium transporter TrkA [Pseudomonadota bacterium]
MRIIVCGAGQVGFGIAERLAAENHSVTVIDSSEALITKIKDTLDVRGVVGHAAHPDVLARAKAENADMIIAVTLYDEVNMVACQVAHSIFQVPTKVARVRSQSYMQEVSGELFSRDHMPIDVIISPEKEVGETVLRRISLPGAVDVVRFADESVVFLAIECGADCPVVDTPLSQLTELFPDLGAVVVGLVDSTGAVRATHSADELIVGDIAYVVVKRGTVRRTLSIFGHDEPDARRIVIAGGGNIGTYVARELHQRMSSVRMVLIENSRARAERIVNDIDGAATVLAGSALDQNILTEADVDRADLMVALTNDDQTNILSAVMAKRLGCAVNMSLLNNASYHDFIHTLGIDAYINPRSVTISRILQYVRRGRIRSVYSVRDGQAEVIEAEALETSPLVGAPLRELVLPEGIRVGSIYRDGEAFLPDGSTHIRAGDRVVIFAAGDAIRKTEQLFRVSLEFF